MYHVYVLGNLSGIPCELELSDPPILSILTFIALSYNIWSWNIATHS